MLNYLRSSSYFEVFLFFSFLHYNTMLPPLNLIGKLFNFVGSIHTSKRLKYVQHLIYLSLNSWYLESKLSDNCFSRELLFFFYCLSNDFHKHLVLGGNISASHVTCHIHSYRFLKGSFITAKQDQFCHVTGKGNDI